MGSVSVSSKTASALIDPQELISDLPYLEGSANVNLDDLVTEDDEPVDSIFSAKQQRLLIEPLYTSWHPERPFLADANVGLFYTPRQPPIVPDAFISLDVQVGKEWWEKRYRSYFFWELKKPPEVTVEVVSNKEGGEDSSKLIDYAGMGILYYVIFDPLQALSQSLLRIYRLSERGYRRTTERWLAEVGIGVQLWEGVYEDLSLVWLRWCDQSGNVLPTGAEQAERARQERQRAEQERQRAEQAELAREQERQRAEQAELAHEQERQRAEQAELAREQERQRAEQLEAQLRALGIEPDV